MKPSCKTSVGTYFGMDLRNASLMIGYLTILGSFTLILLEVIDVTVVRDDVFSPTITVVNIKSDVFGPLYMIYWANIMVGLGLVVGMRNKCNGLVKFYIFYQIMWLVGLMLQIVLDLVRGDTVHILDVTICFILSWFAYVPIFYLLDLELAKAIQKIATTVETKPETV